MHAIGFWEHWGSLGAIVRSAEHMRDSSRYYASSPKRVFARHSKLSKTKEEFMIYLSKRYLSRSSLVGAYLY